jgi:Arc/MetJ family transcription regulator
MSRRTTIEIDDNLLHAAQRALGTSGLKDTVDAAMREAVRRQKRAELARASIAGELYDRDPELLRAARR